jgi:predicted nuclease with TOPRIM domain
MLTDRLKSAAINMNDKILTTKIEFLNDALAEDPAGHVQDWIVHVKTGLDHLEEAWRGHKKDVQDVEGVFAEVDKQRPTLAKQADEIRSDQADLSDELRGLRSELRLAEKADSADQQAAEVAAFRLHAQQILDTLRQTKEAESNLLLESANREMGAGD